MELNSEEDKTIETVLREVLPRECKTVGRTNLTDIVRRKGNIQLVRLEGASKLDWTAPLALLASAAAIVSHCLTIVKNARDARKVKQSEVALEMKFSLPPELATKLDPSTLHDLLAAFAKHFPGERAEKAEGSEDCSS